MVQKYSTEEETESLMVGEPAVEYETVAKKQLRVVTDDELSRCMTLEESERLITEKIYGFYHPEV